MEKGQNGDEKKMDSLRRRARGEGGIVVVDVLCFGGKRTTPVPPLYTISLCYVTDYWVNFLARKTTYTILAFLASFFNPMHFSRVGTLRPPAYLWERFRFNQSRTIIGSFWSFWAFSPYFFFRSSLCLPKKKCLYEVDLHRDTYASLDACSPWKSKRRD